MRAVKQLSFVFKSKKINSLPYIYFISRAIHFFVDSNINLASYILSVKNIFKVLLRKSVSSEFL